MSNVHITVNGRPLCVHSDCAAGREDRVRVLEHAGITPARLTCGYAEAGAALHTAAAWQRVHPSHVVGVILAPCPEIARVIAEAAAEDDREDV